VRGVKRPKLKGKIMKITNLVIAGAMIGALGACAQQEAATDDVIAVFAKDGTIIGYQRVSDGASVDQDGNPVAGFGDGNPRGFGEGASGVDAEGAADHGSSGDDDDGSED
jgi:hypothetical protein